MQEGEEGEVSACYVGTYYFARIFVVDLVPKFLEFRNGLLQMSPGLVPRGMDEERVGDQVVGAPQTERTGQTHLLRPIPHPTNHPQKPRIPNQED